MPTMSIVAPHTMSVHLNAIGPPRRVAREHSKSPRSPGHPTALRSPLALMEKFGLGRPTYRIAAVLAHDGLELAEGTLAGWNVRAAVQGTDSHRALRSAPGHGRRTVGQRSAHRGHPTHRSTVPRAADVSGSPSQRSIPTWEPPVRRLGRRCPV